MLDYCGYCGVINVFGHTCSVNNLKEQSKRLNEWIDWFQDEAVVDFDNRVGLYRRIKEGLSFEEFKQEGIKSRCKLEQQEKDIQNLAE